MQHRVVTYIVALTTFICGIFILASLGAVMAGVDRLPVFLVGPGRFFFQSYSYLSLYIPFYLIAVTVMLLRARLHKPLLFVLTTAVLPLLTFALISQLLTGTQGEAALLLADTFGPRVAASMLLLLGMAEILAIYVLTMHFFYGLRFFTPGDTKLLEGPKEPAEEPGRAAGTNEVENSEQPASPDDHEAAAQDSPEAAASAGESGTSGGGIEMPAAPAAGDQSDEVAWERFDTPQAGISFPDIPELPPLKAHENLQADGQDGAEWRVQSHEQHQADGQAKADARLQAQEMTGAPSGDGSGIPAGGMPDEDDGDELIEELPEADEANETGGPDEGLAGEEAADGVIEGAPAEAQARRFTYANYQVPEDQLLQEYPDQHYWVIDDETRQWAEVLKNTLEEFKISAEVTGIQKGPVITMFEILPAPGVKLSKIVNLADNIALRLAARRVRIVAPIPGKHAVGIEVPNKKRSLVSFREMLQSDVFQEAEMDVPIILGKDITGETQILNLTQTPHLLIAGATGSGKSVCVNSIICSILYTRSPSEVRMVLVDPKIVELKLYNDIPHLLTPVITEPKKAFQVLQYLLYEMERRYSLLDSLGVRDIQSFNNKIKRKRLATERMPYIVVIVDEFADLMATSGKELESTLARLAAMSRAVGIHLVLATQRPSIDVITGLIKANIPSRIAFMVAGKFDSRIIIDTVGAEKLLGQGDMLLTTAWNPHPVRIQGAYLSEEEVENITDYIRTLGEPDYIDDEIFFDEDEEDWNLEMGSAGDPLMEKAVEIVVSAGKASASYLQRRLKIGYNRAARIIEEMEDRGIVGPQNGSKPREILHVPDDFS
ncbi:MAG: DNA translocase FtsK [Sediminispirochaetaceae bacterium]